MKGILQLYKSAFSNIQKHIWILSLATFINRSGSMVLVFTSLYLTRDLHYSISEAGFAMSFYGLGSILGSYTGGWLTDRRNFFKVMLLSLVLAGSTILFMLLTTHIITITIILFLHTFFSDIFRPANAKALKEFSTPENRTRSVSLSRLAINLGFTAGPSIGGFVALYLGYKWLFVFDSLTSFGAAFMLYKNMPAAVLDSGVISEKDAPKLKSRSAYKDIRYLFFIMMVSLYGICFFQLITTMPQFFATQWKYNEDIIGMLLGLNGFLVVLIEMPLVTILEKRKKLFEYVIIGTLLIPVGYFFLLLGKQWLLLAILFVLTFTISEMLAMPHMMNYALSKPAADRQGQYSALYSIGYGISLMLAPGIGMSIADKYGFNMMFYVVIGISLLGVVGFSILHRKHTGKRYLLCKSCY